MLKAEVKFLASEVLILNTLQEASAVVLYEEHVRFMILCEHELSGLSMDVFNSHLNLEQINKVSILSYSHAHHHSHHKLAGCEDKDQMLCPPLSLTEAMQLLTMHLLQLFPAKPLSALDFQSFSHARQLHAFV